MEKNKKMKRALLIILFILLVGCKTAPVYIKPALPVYDPILPDRPELLEISENINLPQEVNINQLLLMTYAEKLEILLENWRKFYSELSTIYSKDDAEKQI